MMTSRKTGNQKRKYACNRYEDIDKYIWKVFDTFGHDEKIENLIYWTRKLQKERAEFRKKAVKYDELTKISTLLDVIKEWESRGFEVRENTDHNLLFRHHKEDNVVEIFKKDLSYMYYPYFDDGTILSIPYDLHNLINKTLKVLGDKVNE